MFRIECFCDDKNLARVLILLQSNVYNLTSAPVVNANKKKGRVIATSKDTLEMFSNYIHERALNEVTPVLIKDFAMSIGKSQGYYSILLRKAIDAGIISRVGVTYRYRVLSPAPATHGGKRKGAGRKVKKHKSKPSQKAKPQKDKPTLVASKPEAA